MAIAFDSSQFLRLLGSLFPRKSLKQPQDISQHNCLLFPLAGYRLQWLFRDKQGIVSKIPVTGNITISSAIALKQCAIAGMGLSLLADWAIAEEMAKGQLIDVLPDYEVTATNFHPSAWLVYPSRTYLPLKVRVFRDFLRKNILRERKSISSRDKPSD